MVRYRRNLVPGGMFFFTVTLADRRSSALTENVDLLRYAFRIARKERPFCVEAIVILPDHLHTILTLPEGDADFPGRWRRIKSLFSRHVAPRTVGVHRNLKGEYALWQRRFWEHTIRDDDDFGRHLDYIHFNPVRHGLVSRVRDWPHSSFHLYVRRGCMTKDWGGDARDVPGGFGEPADR